MLVNENNVELFARNKGTLAIKAPAKLACFEFSPVTRAVAMGGDNRLLVAHGKRNLKPQLRLAAQV